MGRDICFLFPSWSDELKKNWRGKRSDELASTLTLHSKPVHWDFWIRDFIVISAPWEITLCTISGNLVDCLGHTHRAIILWKCRYASLDSVKSKVWRREKTRSHVLVLVFSFTFIVLFKNVQSKGKKKSCGFWLVKLKQKRNKVLKIKTFPSGCHHIEIAPALDSSELHFVIHSTQEVYQCALSLSLWPRPFCTSHNLSLFMQFQILQ